jgi:hypothetical protein
MELARHAGRRQTVRIVIGMAQLVLSAVLDGEWHERARLAVRRLARWKRAEQRREAHGNIGIR